MAKKLWGGRFKKKIDKDFEKFSQSIQYDHKLARVDLFHSIIHAFALSGSNILTPEETKKIVSALNAILKEIDSGKFKPDLKAEDIHTDIHNRLEKKIGLLAQKVHTMRSRNDQIVFNEKCYCLNEALNVQDLLAEVIGSLFALIKKYKAQAFVGYTHMQRAQVILFDDYLLAYASMLHRDMKRMKNFYDSVVPCIGAGALAGSSLDKKEYTQAIDDFFKFEMLKHCKPKAVENSLDNVSDRDFLVEFLSILAIIQMHLSRFAEDLILYSNQEFNYLDLPEEFCTGSSLMPHKKNPDFLELARGYTGPVYGNLMSLLTTMKGLPLAYNRDMQLDKVPLFSSLEIVQDELKIFAKFIPGIELKTEVIAKALEDETLYATELAEFLVYEGVAFKQAHDIVGRLVRFAQDKKIRIKEMTDPALKKFSNKLSHQAVNEIMNSVYAIKSKRSIDRKGLKLDA